MTGLVLDLWSSAGSVAAVLTLDLVLEAAGLVTVTVVSLDVLVKRVVLEGIGS